MHGPWGFRLTDEGFVFRASPDIRANGPTDPGNAHHRLRHRDAVEAQDEALFHRVFTTAHAHVTQPTFKQVARTNRAGCFDDVEKMSWMQ
jgi:hypothetical protein